MTETPSIFSPEKPTLIDYVAHIRDGIAVAIDETKPIPWPVKTQTNGFSTGKVDIMQPERRGILPPVEQRKIVESALSGQASTTPIRYQIAPIEVVRPDQVVSTVEERLLVPEADVVIFHRFNIQDVIDPKASKEMLSMLLHIIDSVPEAGKQIKTTRKCDLGIMYIAAIETVAGTDLRFLGDPPIWVNPKPEEIALIKEMITTAFPEHIKAVLGFPDKVKNDVKKIEHIGVGSSSQSSSANRAINERIMMRSDISSETGFVPPKLIYEVSNTNKIQANYSSGDSFRINKND